MGGRLLRRRVILPLKNVNEINRRLSLVEFFNQNEELKYHISQSLKSISDLDRLIGKLAAEKITPKELGYLKQSLIHIQNIKTLLHSYHDIMAWIEPILTLSDLIQHS